MAEQTAGDDVIFDYIKRFLRMSIQALFITNSTTLKRESNIK
jgi:hypothetical protein